MAVIVTWTRDMTASGPLATPPPWSSVVLPEIVLLAIDVSEKKSVSTPPPGPGEILPDTVEFCTVSVPAL